jgi:hypothetical protein
VYSIILKLTLPSLGWVGWVYHYENNELTDMLLMYGQCYLSRYQDAAAASREYTERFPERHHPGPCQLLINRQDRTQNFRKQ